MENDYSGPQTEGASILGDGAYRSHKNIKDYKNKASNHL